MPRDGSGIYTLPQIDFVPGSIISSAKVNSDLDDLAADLNVARPIVAGGTGQTTAAAALTALGGVAKAGDTMTGDLAFSGGKGVLGAAYLNGGPLGGLRNAIINGNHDIAIRGTSIVPGATGAFVYDLDRINSQRDGTGATVTVTQQTHGLADFAGCPKFFRRYARSVAGSTGTFENFWQQPMEGVGTYAGRQATSVFWAKADAARAVTATLIQNFGTGGSPSSAVFTTISAAINLTTSWQRFRLPVNVPSISGKTLGSAGNDNLALALSVNALNTAQTLDVSKVKLVPGDASLEDDSLDVPLPLSLILNQCKRYAKTLGAGVTGRWGGSTSVSFSGVFDDMRAIPTASILNASPGIIELGVTIRSVTSLAIVNSNQHLSGYQMDFSCAASGATAGNIAVFNTDGVVLLSAEF